MAMHQNCKITEHISFLTISVISPVKLAFWPEINRKATKKIRDILAGVKNNPSTNWTAIFVHFDIGGLFFFICACIAKNKCFGEKKFLNRSLKNATRVFSFILVYSILVVPQLSPIPIFSVCYSPVIHFVTKKKAFCKMPVTFPSGSTKNLAQP